MKIEIQTEWFSLDQCGENPNKLYVFGDNMIRRGKGGQASIRDAFNSIGLVTKRLPTMDEDAFFSDKEDEFEAVEADVDMILSEMQKDQCYDTLVLPADGLGTGLSKMPTKSPELFEHMVMLLERNLNIEYRQ